MDLILDNYFFDLNFKDVFGESRQTSGYSMSYNEDILLSRGMILLKVSYIDSQTVDNLIEKKERLTEDNIYIEKIKFQIDGNNLLHMLALNYNSLQIILNFLAEYDKRYLTMILMKNKENISPLDITIENDSPKCTELMLNSLSKLDTGIYSPLIFERFNKLLEMNIRSFYDYLDSCFFQTIQMQNTKYLPLIHGEFPWVGAHRSCLIDELFREKYTSDGAERLAKRLKEIKQRQELEHKKKIEKAKKDKQKLSKLEMKLLEDKKNREMNFKSLFNAKTFQKEMKGAKKNKGLGFLSSEILEESKQESENLDSDSSRLLTSQVEEKKNYDSFYYPGADHTPASDEELESEEEESSLESDLDSSLNIVEELRPQKTDHQRQMSIIVSNMMRDDIQPGNSMQKPETSNPQELFTKIVDKQKEDSNKKDQLRKNRDLKDQLEAKKKGLPRINVEAVEFGWVLDDNQGIEFLKGLSKTDSIDIFELRMIRTIINYLWKHYRRTLRFVILIPNFIFIVTYIVYVTWIHHEKEVEDSTWSSYYTVNF